MKKTEILLLQVLKKAYQKIFPAKKALKPEHESDPNKCSDIIYNVLASDKPAMVARFGSTELTCLVNYVGVKQPKRSYIKYIQGRSFPWWWNPKTFVNMKEQSGFFSPSVAQIERFCQLMLDDMIQIDVLGSWIADEKHFEDKLVGATRIWLDFITPFFADNPWTRILENKKVLVVHPFTDTIEKQYAKRELLFKNKSILPPFTLKTVKAVQSSVNESVAFRDWFSALDYMKSEIDKVDYDICLVGAGAYGFPLAAHVKRQGKKAVHMGGALQLLFGIRGKRWEDPNLNKDYSFADLMNEHWVRPSENERPKKATILEDACYW